MNPKKKQIRKDRLQKALIPSVYQLRHLPIMTKKRYLSILYIVDAHEEWRIRTNYLKLNKGFSSIGESKLISLLKKRESAKLPFKNRSIVIQHRRRYVKRLLKDS